LSSFIRDLRFAGRFLRKTPGFTVIAVATLALGIGGTTAVFSLVNGILLRPLAYQDPDRLVLISESFPGARRANSVLPACANHFEEWRRKASSFKDMAALRWERMTLSGSGGPRTVGAATVSASFLSTLGVSPLLGRDFTVEEDQPGRDRVILVTDRLWRSDLAASPSIIGQSLRLDGQPHQIIGVLPANFRFPLSGLLTSYDAETPAVDVFKPLAFRARPLNSQYNYAVLARLRPGVSTGKALAELNVLQAAIASQIGGSTRLEAVVRPFQGTLVGKSRAGLLLALAAVGVVLLIACANLAGLLLARASSRRREMAIRAALGASRGFLFRQALADSLCLALCGGAAGVAVAWLLTAVLVRRAPIPLPRLDEVGMDLTVLGTTAALTMLCTLLVGLVPAWQTARAAPQEALQGGQRACGDSAGGHSLRTILVAAQAALGALLLVVAGLLSQSFLRVMGRDRGVEPAHVSTVEIGLAPSANADRARRLATWTSLEESISRLPGVSSSGLISQLPFTREQNIGVVLPKEASPAPMLERPMVNLRYVTPSYFEATGIRLLAGRVFRQDESELHLVVVSRSVARRLWPGQEPIGKEFRENSDEPPYPRVVGIAADVPVASLEANSASIVYHPYWDNPWPRMSIVVRSQVPPSELDAAIRRVVWKIEPEIPVPALKSMERLVSDSVAARRFDLSLVGLFTAAALLLACLGVYGLLSYSVSRRTGEIGIRRALGAGTTTVALQVLRRGMAPVTWGLVVGMAAAAAVTRLLEGMLFEVKPLDTATFTVVPLVLVASALAACLMPALRAARIQPVTALRND
jgi:predicted permease